VADFSLTDTSVTLGMNKTDRFTLVHTGHRLGETHGWSAGGGEEALAPVGHRTLVPRSSSL